MDRSERLAALIEEHGCATECDLSDQAGRYALIETDTYGVNGGPWWSIGNDWRLLLDNSAAQEHAEDWPAETLFDLDSGEAYPVTLAYTVPLDVEPQA